VLASDHAKPPLPCCLVPDRIRVLRVIARMNVGGPARIVADLMDDLDPERFEQRLLTGRVADDEADELEMRPRTFPHIRIDGLGRAPNPLADAQALTKVMSEIRAFRPDIVETHTAKAGLIGRVAAFAARAPVTNHVFHGHLLQGYFSPMVTRSVVTTERLLASKTTSIVAVGVQVRDDLLAAHIGRASQYTVIAPGVEITAPLDRAAARERLGLQTSGPVVAFVGRLAKVKRPDRFAGVAARVASAREDVHFVVAGDGEGLEDLRAAAATSAVRAHMTFLGWRADVTDVYAACDLVLLTSDNEGMPLSLIEAAAAGRAAVTTDVGSAAEVVVSGRTGVVCPIDEAALADAVVRLCADPATREEMGNAGLERARQHFSREQMVSEMATLYERIAPAARRLS
jgi:glycosyltransferase involved in cell wall biosynthesis